MSMAGTVNSAIKIAKRNLGDLILRGHLVHHLGQVYENGEYKNQYTESDVDYVYDKFSFSEENDESISASDIKILIFNNEAGTLEVQLQDQFQLEIDGKVYEVKRTDPVRVGPYTPMITVILKS